MAVVVDIVSRRGLRIKAYNRNQPNKSKVVIFTLTVALTSFT